jgi:hypothetical protein
MRTDGSPTLGLYLHPYVLCRNIFSLCGVLIICLVGQREEGTLEMQVKGAMNINT